jgi:hypothetical protein
VQVAGTSFSRHRLATTMDRSGSGNHRQSLEVPQHDMRVLLSTYGSRGDVEPMVGLAVQSRALGAEECDALVATGVTPAGVWR